MNTNVQRAAVTPALPSLALPQPRSFERMLHAPALLACVPVGNGVLHGHPNTPMWIRIMQVKLFSLSCCMCRHQHTQPCPSRKSLAQRAASRIQVCVRGHIARRDLSSRLQGRKSLSSPSLRLARRLSVVAATSKSEGADHAATGRDPYVAIA